MKMPNHFTSTNCSPFRIQTVASESISYPKHFQGKISVDVIHDGGNIPPELMTNSSINHEKLLRSYQIERDWGADLVAGQIASRLGIGQFLSVNTARCAIDFGRFPGSTKAGATHLGRYAINHPFAAWLSYEEKRSLLENHYDVISDGMDAFLEHKVLSSPSTTATINLGRAPCRLTDDSYGGLPNNSGYISWLLMFPDGLAEFTVDRGCATVFR